MSSIRKLPSRPAILAPDLPPFADDHVMRSILDAMPMRVSYFDPQRRFRYNNREFYNFMRLTPEETLGRTVAQVVGRKASLETRPQVEAVRRGETTRTQSWRYYEGIGRRFVESVFMPLFHPDGTLDGYFALVRDLTEVEQQKEEALRRSQYLAGVLDEIDDAVVIFDADTRLVMCNDGYMDMLGYPAELNVPGTELASFVRNRLERGIFYGSEGPHLPLEKMVEDRVNVHRHVKKAINEIWHREGRWVEIRRRRLPDGSLVSTLTDITAKYEAEHAKRSQRAALRRLEQMEASAILLAGVGHEINNPLAAIIAQAGLLALNAEGTDLGRRLDMIREAAERCGKIVHSLMRSVRRREQRYEAVDIPAMLQLALDLAWNGTTPFGLNITTHIAANLPKPFGDPEQIAHIMSNLVSNATQALEAADLQRPKSLSISAEVVDTDIVIRVVDNGPGIAPEIKERIFDPFFSTKPPEKGTGIGLALCRALARAHGGSLVVEDTPGGGATFVLRLPLSG